MFNNSFTRGIIGKTRRKKKRNWKVSRARITRGPLNKGHHTHTYVHTCCDSISGRHKHISALIVPRNHSLTLTSWLRPYNAGRNRQLQGGNLGEHKPRVELRRQHVRSVLVLSIFCFLWPSSLEYRTNDESFGLVMRGKGKRKRRNNCGDTHSWLDWYAAQLYPWTTKIPGIW